MNKRKAPDNYKPEHAPDLQTPKESTPKKKKTTMKKEKQEMSLSDLTTKFLDYVSKRSSKIINITDLANALEAKKRRIYDITNVLEGNLLIRNQLISKNQQK